MGLPEIPGRQPDQRQKSAIEISDIVESDIHGNIGDPVIASNQTYLCFAYTEIVDLLHGRIYISVLKYMGYIAGTQ